MQPATDAPLDGNAAGGLLSELFAFDVTAATVICVCCDATGEIARNQGLWRQHGRAPALRALRRRR